MSSKFVVLDEIVGDSLSVLSSYRSVSARPVVIGGTAAQLYTAPHYPELLRPTHDIDLITVPKLTADSFREGLGKYLNENLGKYNPKINILRHVMEVKLEDNEKSPFFIHTYKWTNNGWIRYGSSIERQVANANLVPFPTSSKSIYISRPEDIIAGKISRITQVKDKTGFSEDYQVKYEKAKARKLELLGDLKPEEFNVWLAALNLQKQQLPAYYDRGADEFTKALDNFRANKDIFDISLLAKLILNKKIDFDDRYLNEVIAA
ncbi:hypothetical protein HYS31_00950 [Candidatus Woesearchaeota archaeon]|nr:hypothetical protein [Candidatus Woesearchaeota archaeon]